jgi:pectate lyase
MRVSSLLGFVAWGAVAGVVACSSSTDTGDGGDGNGGAGPAGGAAPGGSGGAGGAATGGSLGGTSGATSGTAGQGGSATGGAAPTGGTAGSPAGGASGAGGTAGDGGTGGSSGAATGGASAGGGGTSGAAGAGGKGGAGGLGGAGTGGKGGAGAAGAGSGGKGGSGGTGGASCMTPPPPSALTGWASVSGNNVTTTTGGGSATPVVVTSTSDFNTQAGGTVARVIHVNGNLSGTFTIGSNKTVVGVCGATLRGHVRFSNVSNSILRNIRVVGNNCTDSPQDCSEGADAISITNDSHHVWVDHLDVSDGSDGNLDTNAGSDYVTISWTKFSYSSRRTDPLAGASGHRFSNLVGSGDGVTTDRGKLRVTFHHNWWAQNVDQRMPRTRFGDIHVFNNLYTSSGNSYCTNSGIETNVLVENNVYVGVNNPLSPDANGDMLARGNLFQSTTGNSMQPMGAGFTPPYQYSLDATSNLRATIEAQAGPR